LNLNEFKKLKRVSTPLNRRLPATPMTRRSRTSSPPSTPTKHRTPLARNYAPSPRLTPGGSQYDTPRKVQFVEGTNEDYNRSPWRGRGKGGKKNSSVKIMSRHEVDRILENKR
jgi:hypothetical protein